MKKMLLLLTLGIGGLAYSQVAAAQVSVRVNIGMQPAWGPAGYDYAEYYYLPDIEAYYYVPGRQFIYLSGNRWVFAANLPARYRGYDLYRGYKVVINSSRPYRHFRRHREMYAPYGYHRGQVVIRDRRPYGYREHEYYEHEHGHGRGRDHDRGYGHGHEGRRGHGHRH